MIKKLIFSVISMWVSVAVATELRVIHNDRPIPLIFKIGHEHRFVFPEPVNVDIPQQLMQVIASVQPTQQVVYWTPKVEFPTQRIMARSLDQQRVYLLDISATEKATATDFYLENPALAPVQSAQASTDESNQKPANPFQIELTRFVSRLLYAPTRLRPKNLAIRQLPTPAYPIGVDLLRSEKGESYRYRMIGSWRGYEHHITAIEVINQSPLQVELDMRNVQGNWIAIAAQHTWLGAANSVEDRSTIYLVSKAPFLQAVGELAYGF